uniref:Uncharacterized protein n=1 Tax=Cannabis sativa TaxID=3483 RepID=A0A803R928_CANSA
MVVHLRRLSPIDALQSATCLSLTVPATTPVCSSLNCTHCLASSHVLLCTTINKPSSLAASPLTTRSMHFLLKEQHWGI